MGAKVAPFGDWVIEFTGMLWFGAIALPVPGCFYRSATESHGSLRSIAVVSSPFLPAGARNIAGEQAGRAFPGHLGLFSGA